MTSIFQAGQPFNLVRTSSTTYQASDKDLVISSGDTVELPEPDQGATVLVRPAPLIDSVRITTSNGTIGNTGETYGYYRATEPLYLVGDGTDWYARSGVDEFSAIPDSLVAQFDFREEDGTLPLTDQSGNGNDLSNGGYSGVGRTINGQQAGEFGGDSVYGPLSSALSQPFTAILVIQADVRSEDYVFDGTSNNIIIGQAGGSTTGWFVNAGANSITAGSRDTNAHLLTGVFDSTDAVRLDGTELASGDAGSNDLAGINLGSLGGGGNNWAGAVGFVDVHDGLPSNGLAAREQEIADDWGITL